MPPPIPFPDTLKGVDDLIRSGFEDFRQSWFTGLLVSTALVVVGLWFEFPEIWHESVGATRSLRRSPKAKREISPWMKLAGTLGWVLIVVGVTGEFVSDSFVSRADGFVQKFDEILLADAQKKTGAASERAARAFERAAQTEQEASQENERAAQALNAAEVARKDAEGFQLEIAQANDRASKNEKEAEGLRKDAETEHLARVKLEREMQPRTLDDAARRAIGEKLAKFGPNLFGRKVKVSSYSADAEGVVFSLEIIDVLTRANIDVDNIVGRVMPVGLVDVGVKITGPVSDESFIRALATDIHSYADTDVSAEWDPKYTDLAVSVAAKPVPGLPRINQSGQSK